MFKVWIEGAHTTTWAHEYITKYFATMEEARAWIENNSFMGGFDYSIINYEKIENKEQ